MLLTVSGRREWTLQEGKRNRWLIHWSLHLLREWFEEENVAMAWINNKKGLWYIATKLESRLSKNVHDIWQGHMIHHRDQEKLESEIGSRGTNHCRGENPKKYLQRWRSVTITICHSNDTTHLYTEEVQRELQIYQITLCTWTAWTNLQKIKTIGDSNKKYSQDTEMEFGVRKCTMLITQWINRNNGTNRTAKQRINLNALEIENYKYVGLFEADTIKQAEMKEKLEKSTSEEREIKLNRRNLIKEINTLHRRVYIDRL